MHNLVGEKLKELLKRHGKSLQDLSRQTDVHAARWSQIINGTKRLSIDLAIRLGKVFPDSPYFIWGNNGYCSTDAWLVLQHDSDRQNAEEQDGPMYRNVKPFESVDADLDAQKMRDYSSLYRGNLNQ